MGESVASNHRDGRDRAFERYQMDETPSEAAFETIMSLAQRVLDVPICAVSLGDRQSQWFKAREGLNVPETHRDASLCTHTAVWTKPYVVTDALRDPVFVDHPWVVGEPHVRSYLGVPIRTADGAVLGSLCVVDVETRDFTDLQIEILADFAKVIVTELDLRQLTARDLLSGVLARSTWEISAIAELRRSARYRRPLSLAIFDLDRLKAVNDGHGYSVGDEVIRRFAELCLSQIRDTDILGRFGGEEFVLLLPETPCPAALSTVERLRNTFSETSIPMASGGDLFVTVSAGVTSSCGTASSVSELLRRADHALYDAKRSGRNCTIVDDLIPLEPATGPRELAG